MRIPILLGLILMIGCSDDNASVSNNAANNATTNNSTNNATAGCVPDRAAWDSEVSPLVQTHCAVCHGAEPTYGAPQELVTYESMLAMRGTSSEADLVAGRVAFGTMPPLGMPGLPAADAQKLVSWASCGEQEVMPNAGLTSTAPVFLAPEVAPVGGETIDMLADEFAVGEDVADLYQCFTFQAGIDADKFVRRIEVVQDNRQVLHHIVFLRDSGKNAPTEPHNCVGMPPDSEYLYAWAPGTGPIQFPDGGFRIQPGEQFVVQIHYNNGAKVPNVKDSSGIRMIVGEPAGTEYGMIAPGPLAFVVPGKTVKDVTGSCVLTGDWKVLAGMPHMHENGKDFEQVVIRADGTEEPFIRLENWSFETQLFYGLPVELKAGDTLKTTCTFDNQGLGAVTSGPRTQDEMCFNFMYVTPPPGDRYCDSGGSQPVTDIEYTPGVCAESGALEAPTLTQGAFVVGQPAALTNGVLEDGIYEMTSVEIWRPSADTPIGSIDLEASKILAKGQFVMQNGEFLIDMKIASDVIMEAGQRFAQENKVSIRATRDLNITDSLEGEPVCGATDRVSVPYEVTGTQVEIAFSGNAFGVDFESRYKFEKQ
jgi:hypothetical protein